jgi:hypothetical protein
LHKFKIYKSNLPAPPPPPPKYTFGLLGPFTTAYFYDLHTLIDTFLSPNVKRTYKTVSEHPRSEQLSE